MIVRAIINSIKEIISSYLYLLICILLFIGCDSTIDYIHTLVAFSLKCFFAYFFMSIINYFYKDIVYYIDMKIYPPYFWLKTKIFEYLTKYLETMYIISEKLYNNKNNTCLYYLGKITSLIFMALCIMPLFYPVFTLYLLLGILFSIDLAEFITNYSVLMDSGNSGGGPSRNFGGGPFGHGNFGGGPRNNMGLVFEDLRRETHESKRPQGDFPFVAPSQAYMNLLKDTVSPHHFEKINTLQTDFPNAKIRDWGALRLFDQFPIRAETNYYYIDTNISEPNIKTYCTDSFFYNELTVFKRITNEPLILGRQPLPDVTGLYINSGTRESPIYTQYDPKIHLTRQREKVLYIDKGIGKGLESIGMNTTAVSRRIIAT